MAILVLGHSVSRAAYLAEEEVGSPFRNQDEVREAMHNYRALTALDDARQNRKHGWQARVAVREHIHVRALRPVDVQRRVNMRLDVVSVEVERRDLCLWERAPVDVVGERAGNSMEVEGTHGKPRGSHKIGH